jgi:predicted transcriptional regulator
MKNDKLTAFRIETKTYRALERIGEELDRSVSWLLRKAAEEFVERQSIKPKKPA